MHADAWAHAARHGQDYARAGGDWGLISDGCSSSPDTDCGARLLVLAAAAEGVLDLDGVVTRAAHLAAGLLPPEALDATLLAVQRRSDGQVEATAWGDGLVFGVRRDGVIEAWEIDHGGVPAYPAYRLNPGRLARWRVEGRGVQVRHWVGEVATALALDAGHFPVFSMIFAPSDWRLLGVASDGLVAFRGPEGPVPLPAVLAHVTDIRAPQGRFIERSSGFFLRRTCPRLGWVATDDYSVAALWLGDGP